MKRKRLKTLPIEDDWLHGTAAADATKPSALLRYVVPVGASIALDEDGFFDADRSVAGRSAVRRVEDLIGSQGCFVLLGAGGAGKSETFKALARAENDAPCLDLSIVSPEQLADRAAQAAADHSILYLDTLELFRVSEPAPFAKLFEAVRTALDHRVRLRLSCRTAAWDQHFEKAIKSGTLPLKVFSLAPLDKAAARIIVSRSRDGIDGPGFVRALVNARRGRLSASPQRLLLAAEYWRREGRLPDNDMAAIEYEITAFLKETKRDRPSPIPLDRAQTLARRLAAFAALTRARTFTLEPTVTSATHVDDLPSDPEPDAPHERFTREHLQHVLGTPLFEAAAPGVLAFCHQQYAEFLAAQYLWQRGIDAKQKLALLGIQPNGLLPGVYAGVAAWTLALDPCLIRDVVPGNAVTLLRAGVEIACDQVRAAIVEDLLAQADCGERGAEWGLDLSLAVCPGLEQQLNDRVSDESVPDAVLWWVARLAIAGHCVGLAHRLADLACERARDVSARRIAVQAVARLDQGEPVASLTRLLPIRSEEDPDCELSGALVDALYPQVLAGQQLLPLLNGRPRTPHLVGGFLRALRRLSERVTSADLPVLLAWLAGQARDLGFNSPVDEVYLGLVRRAWEHVDDEPIRIALAQVLIDCPQSARWLLHQHQSDPTPWDEAGYERRRPLIIAIAQRLDTRSTYKLLELRLVGPQDAISLLDDLPSMPEPAARALASCVNMWAHDPTPARRVSETDSAHPAFAAMAQQRVVPSTWPSEEEPEHDGAENLHRQPTKLDERLGNLDEAIKRAGADIGSWWRATDALDLGKRPQPDACSYDLATLEGWHLLTDAEQRWFLDRGIAYVNDLASGPVSQDPPERIANTRMHQAGLCLLSTTLQHTTGKASAITVRAWERLAPTVVLSAESGLQADTQARVDLLRKMPASARRIATAAALDHLDRLHAAGRFAFFYEAYAELSADLGPQIAARLEQEEYSATLATQLLGLLAANAPGAILTLCRSLAQRPASTLHTHARMVLARIDPDSIIDNLDCAQLTLEEDVDVLENLNLARAGHTQLESLASILLDAYPVAQDPIDRDYNDLDGQPDLKLRELRAAALHQLVTRGQPQALATLRTGRPEPDASILLRFERIARERKADLAPLDIAPRTLLKLLQKGDHRLVNSDANLRDVVIEALNRLQHRIRHGAVHLLWDKEERPKFEDTISDWVADELNERFSRGLVVDREVQVERRKTRGVGTRIDLTASAPTRSQTIAKVIIEAKRLDNADLETSLLNQLYKRYLDATNLRYGIYLVYWVRPDQQPADWHKKYPNADDLLDLLTEQAKRAPDDVEITPFIMDISRPAET